ncbi:hypothetical protein U9M48_033752 [Paspalum notatum var. saurae]|uniref:Integrase catalytic domain-containing protein n=1 Tax=Paspalum notatum var. saurae TaxID=547442 RepID=A0AAQ3X6W4_PASNO
MKSLSSSKTGSGRRSGKITLWPVSGLVTKLHCNDKDHQGHPTETVATEPQLATPSPVSVLFSVPQAPPKRKLPPAPLGGSRRQRAMAPPPTAAAGDPSDAEPLEVRCVGCRETLEVDRGLTEFICPDCATPQSLPPELMPPPPPRRKALPLPRGAADVHGARLPCGACGALLSVPVGLTRCACPLCGADLAVDTERLRQYLLSSAATADAFPVVPLGASSLATPILQAREAHSERVHWANKDTARHKKQRNIYSGGPRIVTAETRNIETLNHVRPRAQHLPSSNVVHTKQSCQGNPHRVAEAPEDSANSARGRELGCIAHFNGTASTDINGASGHSIRPTSVNVEKRNIQTPKQIMQKPQKQLSCHVTSPEHARPESADAANHVQEKQQEPGNGANHREKECTRLENETIADNIKRRTRQMTVLNARGAEKKQGQATNDAQQQVRKEQSDSVICRELDDQVTHVENDQPGSCRIHKRKRKGLIAPNSGIQLRRSKRLVKDSSGQTNGHQSASPNGLMPSAILDDEQAESEPDERPTASPVRSLSDAPDIDRIINNLYTSSSPWHGIPQASSNELENLHSTTPPSSNANMSNPEHLSSNPEMSNPEHLSSNHEMSNSQHFSSNHEPEHFSSNPDMSNPEHLSSNPEISDPQHFSSNHETEQFSSNADMSDPEHFARTYIPLDVRRALAKLPSTSLIHHMMPQPNFDEAYLHDSIDSEGQDLQLASQNKGGRPRGLTLCLKVWTMPKGMRIPVSLNASGEPIGKEAATLSAFLGALARDGILAPLAYLDWRCVPDNNKDVMCHIVKLKFDIAPVGESWIVKKLGSKWRSWKALLKKQHFDTHETEEERLADRNPRVLEEQWRFLVAYWSTEAAQAASARNKASQVKVTRRHTSGTKSFARVIEEEKQKRPNKDAPSVEDLFILTHAPKDGRPMTKVAADAIARFREQYQNETEDTGSEFGLESLPNGRMRKGVWKASLKEAMEAKRKAEDEAAALRKELFAREGSQKRLQPDKASVKRARRYNSDLHLLVRCAGCHGVLAVSPGMTEFMCPNPKCRMAQRLPPELIPKCTPSSTPPPKSPAKPSLPPATQPRRGAPPAQGVDPTKIQLPCARCQAILNVPHGLARFRCPQCGVDLAVDHAKLQNFLASSNNTAPSGPGPTTQGPPAPFLTMLSPGVAQPLQLVAGATIPMVLPAAEPPEEINEVAIDVEREEDEGGTVGETFTDYRPPKLSLGLSHPDPVVETSSLSAVQPPEPTYSLNIMDELDETKALSCLQIETIVYACQRHLHHLPTGDRTGFFIGDGAGVGKGRTIAGLIWENWQQGRHKAVWVSVGSDLKYDARRDLDDVGAKCVQVHPLNKLPYSKLDSKAIGIKDGLNSIVRERSLPFAATGSMCHKAKNLIPDAGSQPTRTGKAVLEIQEKLPKARVVYCSATGASEPRNLGYMIRLGLWGEGTSFHNFPQFLGALEKGGVGALELVAMDMKARGMYVCRTLSYKGVDFDIVEASLEERMMNMYRKAAEFWSELRLELLSAIELFAEDKGNSNQIWRLYWASHQRFFRHMCMSAKVPAVVRLAKEALADNKCVVIGLQSTGEARTEEAVTKYGVEMEDFVSGPRELLLKLVEENYPLPPKPDSFQQDRLFDLVHRDPWTSPRTRCFGYKYYLVVVDDFSHYSWTFPLRFKSETFSTLSHFFAWVSTQFGLTIKAVQCDNGREFDNNASRSFFLTRGVQLRMSCPYTSAQNGKAERMIRTTNDVMRTLLFQASLPARFWAESLHTATYLINRLPSTASPAPTPHHALFGTPPRYDHLRVFGCACYPNTSATAPHKLAPRSTRGTAALTSRLNGS